MKKLVMSAVLVGFSVLGTGCAGVMSPVMGSIFTDVQYSVNATDGQAGTRVGEACANSYVGLVATGDASIETARKNGGITNITSVDADAFSVLGVYSKYCTWVRGR